MAILHDVKKVRFYSVLTKHFTDEDGNNVEYYEAVVFPIDANGNESDEPEKIGVKKDCLPMLQALNRDEIVTIKLEAYVKKAKISAVKK